MYLYGCIFTINKMNLYQRYLYRADLLQVRRLEYGVYNRYIRNKVVDTQ